MARNARRVTTSLALAVTVWLAAAQAAFAAPTITRTHQEFDSSISSCGINEGHWSIDVFSLTNDARNHSSVNHFYKGTIIDSATGDKYQVHSHDTQILVATKSGTALRTSQHSFVVVGPAGGLFARGVAHLTVRPDGTITDFEWHFVRCRPA